MCQERLTNFNDTWIKDNHLRVNVLIVLIGSTFLPGRFACLQGVSCYGESKSRTFRHESTVWLNSYTNYDAAGKEPFVFHLENQVHKFLMPVSGLRNKYIVD